MNRLTGKECFSLREAYYSIYNQEIAEKLGSELLKNTGRNLVSTQLPKVVNFVKDAGKSALTSIPRKAQRFAQGVQGIAQGAQDFGKSALTSMTPATQRVVQGVKDEAGRLGNRFLFDTIPGGYRASKELLKTAGSYPANVFRYSVGDRSPLRNSLVQAVGTALGGDWMLRGKNSVIAPVIRDIKKNVNPNLNNNYQMDDDKFIIECLNLIANHLIEEKYASNEKAALKIIENMSEGWTHNILQNYLEE